MVNEWTRADLPAVMDLVKASVDAVATDPSGGAYAALDAVVEHLNAHHPKPDTDRWRRAHSIVEGERDQARRERDMWKEKCLDTDEALHRARASLHEACKVAQSYKVDAYQATERAEAAEARTAPAVTRAGVKNAIDTCFALAPKINTQVISDAVCDFLGVEAEPADPLLDKAQEFAALADWELTDREAELLHTVAAHVLGQEAGDE